MADPTVKLIFAGNAQEAERAIASLERKFASLEEKLKRTNQEGKKQEKTNPFRGADDGVTALIGRMATLATVSAGVRKILDDIYTRGQKALETQVGRAGATENLAINLPPDVPLAQAQATARRIAKQTGVPVDRVMGGLASSFSAMGNLPSSAAIRATELSAQLVPNLPDFQETLSGAQLDVRKLNPDVSEEQALGMLRKTQRMSRITSFDKFTRNLSPGALAAGLYDKDVPGNMALGAAMTQIGNDPMGEMTRTAMLQLVGQTREFFGAQGEGKTNADLMRMLGDDKTRETFLKGGRFGGQKWQGASFEQRFKKPIEEMLTPGSEANNLLSDYQKNIGTFAQAEADYIDLRKQLGQDASKAMVDQGKQRGEVVSDIEASDITNAAWASNRTNLEAALKATGLDFSYRFSAARRMDLSYFGGADPQEGLEAAVGMVNRSLAFEATPLGGQERSQEQTQRIIDALNELVSIGKNQVVEEQKKPLAVQGQRE